MTTMALIERRLLQERRAELVLKMKRESGQRQQSGQQASVPGGRPV